MTPNREKIKTRMIGYPGEVCRCICKLSRLYTVDEWRLYGQLDIQADGLTKQAADIASGPTV